MKPENLKLRDMEKPSVFGYDLDRKTLLPIRKTLKIVAGADYGADPIGNGMFRMVPSGEIVNKLERDKRLHH